jgi:tetratricopeptide (TPR) repeat protein
LRARFALGEIEDALNATDELKNAGEKGSELDYLYGLGFFLMAKRAVAEGQQNNTFVGSQFSDAVVHLKKATSADGERYRDAFAALAEAAWYEPDLPTARQAADRAIALQPKNADAWLVRGRVALAQFISDKDDAAKKALADDEWKAARDSFDRAASELASKGGAEARSKRAQASVELGHALMWKQDKEGASKAYGVAMSCDPASVDFLGIDQALGPEDFLKAIESAKTSFHSNGDAAAEASLEWWLGYARFDRKKFTEAETAFRAALAKNPQFLNSLYYVYRADYELQKYAEAIAALRSYLEADSAGLAQAMSGSRDLDLARLEYLVGWCVDPEKHDGQVDNQDAALLSDVCTRIAPNEARYWNNLGLFVRDQGDELKRKKTPTSKVEFDRLWERSYAAYRRALELSPEDPNYLNDNAVMLHYYLERDYDQAIAMYEKAFKNAEALLARKDLDAQKRADVETAKRDSKNNLELLKKKLEKKPGESGGGEGR